MHIAKNTERYVSLALRLLSLGRNMGDENNIVPIYNNILKQYGRFCFECISEVNGVPSTTFGKTSKGSPYVLVAIRHAWTA